tara:strand:- start:3548 stop:4237 length:690 start_codon:yes stop_codon:yes gene_type:complete
MATSGSKNFELDVADYIEEAFERVGLELRTGYDLKTATRSLNLMLAEWANRGLNQWTVKQKIISLSVGTVSYTIDSVNPTATIDVLDAFNRETINSTDNDLTMTRMSRAEYSHLATKTSTGKPTQFFVDKQISPTITVWPSPDKAGYSVHLNVLSRMDDADAAVDTLDIPFRFYPCLAAGLAYYLAMKRAPERMPILKQVYDEEFQRAMDQDRAKTSFYITPGTYSDTP